MSVIPLGTEASTFAPMEALEARLLLSGDLDWTGRWNVKGLESDADTSWNKAWLTCTLKNIAVDITALSDGGYLLKAGSYGQWAMTESDNELRYQEMGLDEDGGYHEMFVMMRYVAPGVAMLVGGDGGFNSPAKTDLWWSGGYAGLATRGTFVPTNRPWVGEYDMLGYELEADGMGEVTIDTYQEAVRLTDLGRGQFYGEVIGSPDEHATFALSGSSLQNNMKGYDEGGGYCERREWVFRGPNDILFSVGADAGFDGPAKTDLYWACRDIAILVPREGFEYRPDLVPTVLPVTWPAKVLPGDKLRVPIQIRNLGNAPAVGKLPIDVGFGNDVVSVLRSVNIKPQGSQTVYVDIVIPMNAEPGARVVNVRINSNGAMAELTGGDQNNHDYTGAYGAEVVWQFGNVNGRNRKLTLVEEDGTRVTFGLTGLSTGTVDGQPVWDVRLANTTATTIATITTRKSASPQDDGRATTIGTILSEGPLKSLLARTTDPAGVDIAGWIGNLSLGDPQDGCQIQIGGMGPAAALSFGRLHNAQIDSATPIKSLTAVEWTRDGDAWLQAPWVGALTTTGRKANLKLGQPALAGDLQASILLTDSAAPKGISLGKMTVAGWFDRARLAAACGIGTVTVGGLSHAEISADRRGNIGALGQLPDAQNVFDALSKVGIASLTVTGKVRNAQGFSTLDSIVAAPSLGTVTLYYPRYDNSADGGEAWGLASLTRRKLTIRSGTAAYVWPNIVGDLADFQVSPA